MCWVKYLISIKQIYKKGMRLNTVKGFGPNLVCFYSGLIVLYDDYNEDLIHQNGLREKLRLFDKEFNLPVKVANSVNH